MTQEDINQLSQLEQSLSSTISQKQQFNKQLLEVESALGELKDSDDGYQIVGSIMIKKSANDIRKGLDDKKKILEVRLQSYEKQELMLKEQMKKIQEQVIAELNKQEKGEKL